MDHQDGLNVNLEEIQRSLQEKRARRLKEISTNSSKTKSTGQSVIQQPSPPKEQGNQDNKLPATNDAKNLLYFLPCSFYREAIGSEYEIFRSGQQLSLADPQDSVVKIRSNWQRVEFDNIIQRLDFEGMTPQFWGSYNGKALADLLNMNEYDFCNRIKVQFEVDQNLEFNLLLCRENPHYLIPSDIPALNAGEKIGKPSVICGYEVLCDIAVCTAESSNALNTDGRIVIFEVGKDYRQDFEVFWHDNGTIEQWGLIRPLPPFLSNGKNTFYFQYRLANTDSWERIGELPETKINTDYPCKYHVSLDEKGFLRIHPGEVPYRTCDDKKCLLEEGYVFRTSLDP